MRDGLSCCVCLKDEPFQDNPIVSCDGKACSTVVHKACYGIQNIPDGAWFCQKCISQERTARVRCELCPSREGALKHTNKGGWCHIVCALFVPGAEFLDVDRLETVSLDKVASDKLNKVCTICEKNNRLDRASAGACIQCIKSGCKVMFHVTCAQSLGLLTESVSAKEGVRYVAYCSLHKQKTKGRDFTIRLSSSTTSPSRHEKNKLRQSPPQLEKSDEDCVTPQESSSLHFSSSSSKNPNISSSSSNINISSDSLSQDDSSAPEICTSSDFRESKENSKMFKERNFTSKNQSGKCLERLQPPNLFSGTPSTDNLPPPNICCSDASESIPKEEATVKFNQFPSSSSFSTKSTDSETSMVRSSKRQATMTTSHIPQKREKQLKIEEKVKSSVDMVESPIKLEKIKKSKKISMAVKMKIENRVGKKSVAPSLPKSIFNHMSSMISGSSSTNTSVSVPLSSASTSKISGTSCQSMEELLEWQWDQAGALLMQQAEASDIASLLSCLHDLKNENEQLLSKQLKLSHRRDHLKAINAKLQLQLMPKPSSESGPKTGPSIPSITMNDFRATLSQGIVRPVVPKVPPADQTHIQYKQLPHTSSQMSVSSEVARPRLSAEGSSVFIQQPISMWTQSPSQQNQSLNQQTIALLKHYQQQQQHGPTTSGNQSLAQTGVSVSNLFSQTDLVALLNNQLHSQLTGCSPSSAIVPSNQTKSITQDVHISPNNGTNMEFLYQTLQQKNQQQQQHKYQSQAPVMSGNMYYQTSSKVPTQPSPSIKFDSSIPHNPVAQSDKGYHRIQIQYNSNEGHQITRTNDCPSKYRSVIRRQKH